VDGTRKGSYTMANFEINGVESVYSAVSNGYQSSVQNRPIKNRCVPFPVTATSDQSTHTLRIAGSKDKI
jgi:hypothetical protein